MTIVRILTCITIMYYCLGMSLTAQNNNISPNSMAYDMPAYQQAKEYLDNRQYPCLLYTSPSPRDRQKSRMPSSA